MNRPTLARSESIQPVSDRADRDLAWIRRTMEGAGTFTAIPGWWMCAIGFATLPTAYLASRVRLESPLLWLVSWGALALLSIGFGVLATRAKARRLGVPLTHRPYRRFLVVFSAPLVAAAALTPILLRSAGIGALPGSWLLLYGSAMIGGGSLSIRPVFWMGWAFLLCGIAALFLPGLSPDLWMVLGFGLLHVGFGVLIGGRHGG
jgi:hypothetical protein